MARAKQHKYTIRYYFSAITLCFSLLTFPQSGLTQNICTCKQDNLTLNTRYERAFAVFTGTVTKTKRRFSTDEQWITFDVLDSWKGARHEHITVRISSHDALSVLLGSTCGYRFKRGASYLIFSYKSPSRNEISRTSNCGNIVPLEQATDFIRALGSPAWQFNIPPLPQEPHNPTKITPALPTQTLPNAPSGLPTAPSGLPTIQESFPPIRQRVAP